METTFRIIGKRWTVLIIREILKGNTQFNRFMENIEGISPKVEYSLTDMGKGFEPVLLSAASFSMMHMPTTVFKDGKPRTPDQILTGRR
jgi:DNA-binding HxlR family transcriptional regulator